MDKIWTKMELVAENKWSIIFSDFCFIPYDKFKAIKVFWDNQFILKVSKRGSGIGQPTSEMWRPPLQGATGYFILAHLNRFGAAN